MRVLICFTLLFTVFAASARSDPVKITAASDPADPVGGEEKPKYKPNLLQVAENLNLTSFLKVVQQCGLHRMINHEGKYTQKYIELPKLCSRSRFAYRQILTVQIDAFGLKRGLCAASTQSRRILDSIHVENIATT